MAVATGWLYGRRLFNWYETLFEMVDGACASRVMAVVLPEFSDRLFLVSPSFLSRRNSEVLLLLSSRSS